MQSGQFGRVRRTRKISVGVLTQDFVTGFTPFTETVSRSDELNQYALFTMIAIVRCKNKCNKNFGSTLFKFYRFNTIIP